MKKVIVCDFIEYNSTTSRLGNYNYCNCFVNDSYEALWISNAFNQLIYFKDKEDYHFKKSISTAKRHRLADHVYGFAPYSLRLYGNYPLSRNPNIIKRFEKFVIPNISKSLKQMDFFHVDVLWISNPKMYWLTNVVQYEKLIYRIADDYSQFSEFPNIATIDRSLIEKADGVVIASSTLEQHVLACKKVPLLLSNGVTFEHFSKSGVSCPPEYQNNGRKRVVYVGALKYWFDTDLVRKIAEQTDAEIFLIGKCETDLSALKKYKNIHLLGARNYELLPGYLQYADVALIPFIKNTSTDSVSPIKLYEYCSAGAAVVSTNLTETAKQNAPIWIADSHESFVAGVKHYLSQGYDRSKLIDFGRRNSWAQRYELMKESFL